mgnify:CR=1 FL=1
MLLFRLLDIGKHFPFIAGPFFALVVEEGERSMGFVLLPFVGWLLLFRMGIAEGGDIVILLIFLILIVRGGRGGHLKVAEGCGSRLDHGG